MAHGKEVRDAVRRDYIAQGMAPEVLGPMHGVGVATVIRWRREARDAGDNWDRLRTARRLGSGGPEELAMGQILEFLELNQFALTEIRKMRESPDGAALPIDDYTKRLVGLQDGFNKMMAASRRILPQTDRLMVAAGVVEEFAAFLSDKHPALMARFLDVLPEFQQIVEKKYG